MKKMKPAAPARFAAAVIALVLAAVLAGCGSGNASSNSGTGSEASAKKSLTVGIVPGWTTDLSLMNLYKAILEPKGYTLNIKEFSEVATIFAGTAKGDLDALSGAPERIHKAYWDQYKDKLEDLNTYNTNTALFLAVPDYMTDVQSVSDLPARASEFGNRIVGIEPGAGLTKLTQDKVIPGYGLDGFKLQLSSTAAMLTEVKKATDAHQPVVATMWTPFWAMGQYKMRALKDPKRAFGAPEATHTLARTGFSRDYPEVSEMMKNFKLTDDEFGSLENKVVNEFGKGRELEAAQSWLKEHPDFASAFDRYFKK